MAGFIFLETIKLCTMIVTFIFCISEHINISFWICPLKFLVAILILFCIILIWVGRQIITSSPTTQNCMLLSIPIVILFLFSIFEFLSAHFEHRNNWQICKKCLLCHHLLVALWFYLYKERSECNGGFVFWQSFYTHHT